MLYSNTSLFVIINFYWAGHCSLHFLRMQLPEFLYCAFIIIIVCVFVLQTMPSAANIYIMQVNTVFDYMCCIVQYIYIYVFKTITGCDCYPLLVLGLPNDFLFHLEPKVARWDHCTSTGPPTAYWGWTSTWVGGVRVWQGWGRWSESGAQWSIGWRDVVLSETYRHHWQSVCVSADEIYTVRRPLIYTDEELAGPCCSATPNGFCMHAW